MPDTSTVRPALWVAGTTALLGLLSVASVGLLAVRMDRVGRPAFVFLTWNLFLAWVPFLVALAIAGLHTRRAPRPVL